MLATGVVTVLPTVSVPLTVADQDEDCLKPDIEHQSEAMIRERRRDWEGPERRQGEYRRRVRKAFEDNKRLA